MDTKFFGKLISAVALTTFLFVILLKVLNGVPAIYEENLAKGIFDKSNIERQIPLKWSDCLEKQATSKAEAMSTSGEYEHYIKNSTPWDYVSKCYNYQNAGENLALWYSNSEDAYRALMNSPSHKENIVNPKFIYSGVGCYKNVCVQFFSDSK